ncbi:MAG: GTP cyclohydrolase I FolE [Verrucomicrobia bacterium]|nr:GTP cyclohydrolase I FolE [Verrucomicrobiota bacterium]
MTLTTSKIDLIADAFRTIMETLGLDLTDPSLKDTPERVAKMYVEELFIGLDSEAFPVMRTFENPYPSSEDGIIQIDEISVKSVCEHHFLPFVGKARIAYIPSDRILGLSKAHRLVHYFCKRPQLQERLTVQIADALCHILQTEDVAVLIEAEHFCVTMRGASDSGSTTRTRILRGKFLKARDPFQ